MNELNVKVGDEVIYHPGGFYSQKKVTYVTKITPTGRIKVECSKNQYNAFGTQMGGDGWNRSYIRTGTEEEILQIRKDKKIQLCLNRMEKVKELTYEQAIEILNILDGKE